MPLVDGVGDVDKLVETNWLAVAVYDDVWVWLGVDERVVVPVGVTDCVALCEIDCDELGT